MFLCSAGFISLILNLTNECGPRAESVGTAFVISVFIRFFAFVVLKTTGMLSNLYVCVRHSASVAMPCVRAVEYMSGVIAPTGGGSTFKDDLLTAVGVTLLDPSELSVASAGVENEVPKKTYFHSCLSFSFLPPTSCWFST